MHLGENEDNKMKIVTGYKGIPHISSNDQQAFNQGVFGNGNYVLNVGNMFTAELTNVNTVTVSDGEGIIQGVHFRIEPDETETINISNGATGTTRIDLICARYTKDAGTGIEDVSLVLIQGEPAELNPEVPEYNTGDILTGATIVDFPLYEVDVDGLTPTLKPIFKALGDISNISKVGTIVSASNVNEYNCNNTWTNTATLTLSPGTYFVLGYAFFERTAANNDIGVSVGLTAGQDLEASCLLKSSGGTWQTIQCMGVIKIYDSWGDRDVSVKVINGNVQSTVSSGLYAIKMSNLIE